MNQMPDANGNNRLDRIEQDLQALVNSVSQLAGTIDGLVGHIREGDRFMARLAEAQLRLAETQNATEEKLNALISIVDDVVRKRPPGPAPDSD